MDDRVPAAVPPIPFGGVEESPADAIRRPAPTEGRPLTGVRNPWADDVTSALTVAARALEEALAAWRDVLDATVRWWADLGRRARRSALRRAHARAGLASWAKSRPASQRAHARKLARRIPPSIL